MPDDWSRRERGIHDVIVRNITAYSEICCTVRLLPVNSHIENVVIDGVIDTSPNPQSGITILLGEGDSSYGVNLRDGMRRITLTNVISNSRHAVEVAGYLSDSVIANVIGRHADQPVVHVAREDGMVSVSIAGLLVCREENLRQ